MDLAARPHITAGVALASAAVLAAGPMAQHLPDLHLAQHLPTVSVADINLTAADGVLDLFSGVENELASLTSGASAAAVPAAALTDFFDPSALPLPVYTWVSTLANAGTQLQATYNTWSATPFPVLQQIAANGISYVSDYVGAYQQAGTGAFNYLTGTATTDFMKWLNSAYSAYMTGNISGMVSDLYEGLYAEPIADILTPLESILKIPAYAAQNLSNGLNYATSTGIGSLGIYGIFDGPGDMISNLGTSLQTTFNLWNAGDQLGAVTNLINTPGTMANGFLNGLATKAHPLGTGGYLANPNGLLNQMANVLSQALAKTMVAPNAQNIASGGSLVAGFQNLGSQLISALPTASALSGLNYLGSGLGNLANELGGNFAAQLTQLLQSVPSALANLPAMLGTMGGALAGQIGSWVAALLRLL
ncbi:hypothetical protein H7H82_19690 [Mycobacterium heidelbergense]|uniref:hypothetical protein n=1 Tax=Mycobacterium heidelbergense TaxID=53376 RepID=UPI00114E5F9C|nr:hypothetical protein [Mycobacterium heidelbergense]MCV7052786.1 hypothetical protein [Mycobacterium heidelbergense]BBZ49955.1 hypothetical protein MHEI_16720 [Mycobacterium heidelbergense]